MLEVVRSLFFIKSVEASRGQSRVPVENVQRMLIDRSATHWGHYERQGRGVTFVHALPTIERVTTWEQSATHRWSLYDLEELKNKSPRRLAAWLEPDSAYFMPELEAEAVVELVMHDEPRKAHRFMHEIIRRRPRAVDTFHQNLGRHVSQIILSPTSF